MKNSITPRRGIAAVIGTAALVLAVTTGPAMAVAGDTPVTLTVSGGSLSITVTEASAPLGAANPGANTNSANLGDVVVTDTRAGVVGWNATASSSTVTSITVATVIPLSAITYTAPTGSTTGTSSVATASGVMTDPRDVKIASAVTGNNTATWNPSIVVAIPAQALAATDYTATITTSVA